MKQGREPRGFFGKRLYQLQHAPRPVFRAVLASGGNVAVVFRGELPASWKGKLVVSGDESDLRFKDPKNVVVGLVEKGRAKKDSSGFVVEPV
jgi:hypothetical protein